MTVHNKGPKSAQDRAVLINSYYTMEHDFRLPKDRRLNAADISRLSNEALFKLNKDIYSQATVKQAKRLAVKMGLLESPWKIFMWRFKKLFAWWRVIYSPQGAAHVK